MTSGLSLKQRTLEALEDGDFVKAQALARSLTELFPEDGEAWRFLGICLQAEGHYIEAFEAFEKALAKDPEDLTIALALSQAAAKLGEKDLALSLSLYIAEKQPEEVTALIAVGDALLALESVEEAKALCQSALEQRPEDLDLWHFYGRCLRAEGDYEQAYAVFHKCLETRPEDPRLIYDLAWITAELGLFDEALNLSDKALGANLDTKAPDVEVEHLTRFLKATILLSQGRLQEGWRLYQSRHDLQRPDTPIFDVPLPRWQTEALYGKSFFVMGEQGLGDEIAFLGLVPDLIRALGVSGRLTLGLDPRLKSMVKRTWPQVRVLGYETKAQYGKTIRRVLEPLTPDSPALSSPVLNSPTLNSPAPDSWTSELWAPLGDCLAHFRANLADFPEQRGYLIADAGKTKAWQTWLNSLPGRYKIGLSWRSGKMLDGRKRGFASPSDWKRFFQQGSEDCCFINLQYGQGEDEIKQWEGITDIKLYHPPELDLFKDLEGLAALLSALDLVIGFSNATTNLAGAVGADLILLTQPRPWTALGSEAYPWYPQALRLSATSLKDWPELMERAHLSLKQKISAVTTLSL